MKIIYKILEIATKVNQYTDQNESETIPIPLKPKKRKNTRKSIYRWAHEIKQSDLKMKNDAIVQVNVKSLTETTRSFNLDNNSDNLDSTAIKWS